MSREFKVPRSPYAEGDVIFHKGHITVEPGLTVLVGCNGSGKSTFLKFVQSKLAKEEIAFISYNNLSDGGSSSVSSVLFSGNASLAGALLNSSEGEAIHLNIGILAERIGKLVQNIRGCKELWILIDGADSGLSIDNIISVKQDLFDTILKDKPAEEVYIVVSANTYEMCADANCLDVCTGKYLQFKSYKSYKSFVMKSAERKKKRFD